MNTFNRTFFILFLSFSSQAQNNGFIGKKNIFSIDARLYIPVIYNVGVDEKLKNKTEGTTFIPAKNLLASGINFTLGRTLSNKVAFLLQGSISRYKIIAPYKFYSQASDGTSFSINNARSTFFKSSAIGIMPVIELAGFDGILPVGLSHQFGVGFYKHKMVNTDYLILGGDFFGGQGTYYNQDDLIDYDNIRANTYSLMYKMNLRLPITRSILWNIGIRYNINFTANSFLSVSGNSSSKLLGNAAYRELVRETQRSNLVSIETGISFAF